MAHVAFFLAFLAPYSLATPAGTCNPHYPEIKNLVSFGDSYTDESRLDYLFSNNFTPPPPGTILPERNETASGGFVWPRFVAQKTSARTLNYAIGGSTCSPDVVERPIPIPDAGMFGTVLGTQVPTYLADLEFESELYGPQGRKAENTVYTLWIGTARTVGSCTARTSPGRLCRSLSSVTGNSLTPSMEPAAAVSAWWCGDTLTWMDKVSGGHKQTRFARKMAEYSTSVNTMLHQSIPFHGGIAKRWPGATVTFFDVHALSLDIFADPEVYLESPAELTEYYRLFCRDNERTDCVYNEKGGPASRYFWFDELHPSERVEEIIADEFIKLLKGETKYSKTYRL
ncbi:hypothetical protein BJY04DRAFT_213238 [Aspergillus karnatakaensis]|uniref:uncharacterized protein n=1 Tax=Aspergillus karnatakaensis TaxID=1810916 RepID=UPI003CCDF030